MNRHLEQAMAKDIRAAAASRVEDVYRHQCNRLGWTESTLEAWESSPVEEVASHGWQAVVYRTGLVLARQIETEDTLPYHNRTHAAEVLVALGWLIQREYTEGTLVLRSEGLKLMAAMVGHDLDYASIPWDAAEGTAESHSAGLLERAFNTFPVRSDLSSTCQELVAIVLATNPAQAGVLSERFQASPHDMARRREALAVEADLLASLLPSLGPERGERLAREWAQRGNPAADAVASACGRRHFLRSLQLNSQAAHHLGLPQARDAQLGKSRMNIS